MFSRYLNKLFVSAVSMTLLWLVPVAAEVILKNDDWRIDLDPATLALTVQPAGKSRITISIGADPRAVSNLKHTETSARWQWDSGQVRIKTDLVGQDLLFEISAVSPSSLKLIHQPGRALGRGLLLPLAEGRYVPAGDAEWRSFLLNHRSEFDTSQSLSLPLWSMDHGKVLLSWILTNPFNNKLEFLPDGDGLAMVLTHDFTALQPENPMTFMLHLGDAGLLSGGHRYRDWLDSNGRFESLDDKVARAPLTERLLGATQVYLWDGGLLAPADVKNWKAFLRVLKGKSAFASELRKALDKETVSLVGEIKGQPYKYQRNALINGVNDALYVLARARWQGKEPDMDALTTGYGALRSQVADVFSEALIADSVAWGGGVAVSTMKRLRAAGLEKLWIGIADGWEPGLWRPEAIGAAGDAGFLVGPYDSYQTAVQFGERPDWTTPQLGAYAYNACAVILENGKPKAGFRQNGRYTNPECIRPVLRKRIAAVASRVPFNSWFLDAYATGMVFDSYDDEHPISQADYAVANEESGIWVSKALSMAVGSEDGNATTSRGYAFAHGMQTPVFGWDDKDMTSNRKSPYFRGRWYPDTEPGVFFKPMLVKDIYRKIHFAPETRLPLYQSVFHGAVITSDHWYYDALKLTNVQAERTLTQMLYNVPPMVHLSKNTLKDRLPVMLQLDAFFRPLHERLGRQKMTGFEWLSEDRLLQQTMFEDDTRLVANFSEKPMIYEGRTYPAQSVSALLPDGDNRVFTHSELGN